MNFSLTPKSLCAFQPQPESLEGAPFLEVDGLRMLEVRCTGGVLIRYGVEDVDNSQPS